MNGSFEWFVAWRYLRGREWRPSALSWTVLGACILGAVGSFWGASRVHPPQLFGDSRPWKQIYELCGIGALQVAIWVGVFMYLRRTLSVFPTISAFGVFLGTSALVVALSVMNGFEVDLRKKILGSNAHLLVTKKNGPFAGWQEVEARLDGVPGVVAHSAYLASEVVLASGSNYATAIIKGIVPGTAGLVTDLERNLDSGSSLAGLWPISDAGSERNGHGFAGANDAGKGYEPPDFSGEGWTQHDDEYVPPDFSGDVDKGLSRAYVPPDFSGDVDKGLSRAYVPPDFSGDVDKGLPRADLPPDFSGPPQESHDARLRDLFDRGEGSLSRFEPIPQEADSYRLDRLDGIIVGRELKSNLNLYVNQEVQVVSPLGEDTPVGQVPRTRSFRVAGAFFSGMYEYDTKFVYVALPALQSFLSMGDEVDGIEIKVANIDNTQPVVARVAARLGPDYRVQDWKELNRSLFSALKLEKIFMFFVLCMIIFVASLSIISNLIVVVVEKAKEIAILKTLGASNPRIMIMFMIEGIYIGLNGTIAGLVVGVAACLALDRFGLPLPPGFTSEVFYLDRLPVTMEPTAILGIAAAGVLLSLLATIYPSYIALRMRPVEGLRYE